jgi:transposase
VKNIELRVQKGSITYEQLAKCLGVSINTIYNWFSKDNLDEVKRLRLLNAINEIREGK